MVFNANFNDISATGISWRTVYRWKKPEYPDPAADTKATLARSRFS
jgi:hypothetical protein